MALSNSGALRESLATPSAQGLENGQRAGMGSSALQISRRLDWRFLLPDPRLRRTAYVGCEDEVLLSALGELADSLTIIPPTSRGVCRHQDGGVFDLVALRSRNWADLRQACSLLRTGGQLYWEIERSNWRSCFREATGINKWEVQWRPWTRGNGTNALGDLGFRGVRIHWHRPNFRECREIIPMGGQGVFDYVLSRHYNGVTRRVVSAVARTLANAGLLACLAPCISVIAHKG
jgi:hypothetical protein